MSYDCTGMRFCYDQPVFTSSRVKTLDEDVRTLSNQLKSYEIGEEQVRRDTVLLGVGSISRRAAHFE